MKSQTLACWEVDIAVRQILCYLAREPWGIVSPCRQRCGGRSQHRIVWLRLGRVCQTSWGNGRTSKAFVLFLFHSNLKFSTTFINLQLVSDLCFPFMSLNNAQESRSWTILRVDGLVSPSRSTHWSSSNLDVGLQITWSPCPASTRQCTSTNLLWVVISF